jgi:hypothetical protein
MAVHDFGLGSGHKKYFITTLEYSQIIPIKKQTSVDRYSNPK